MECDAILLEDPPKVRSTVATCIIGCTLNHTRGALTQMRSRRFWRYRPSNLRMTMPSSLRTLDESVGSPISQEVTMSWTKLKSFNHRASSQNHDVIIQHTLVRSVICDEGDRTMGIWDESGVSSQHIMVPELWKEIDTMLVNNWTWYGRSLQYVGPEVELGEGNAGILFLLGPFVHWRHFSATWIFLQLIRCRRLSLCSLIPICVVSWSV